MPRLKQPLWLIWKHDDNHLSKQILREFETYAKDTGFYLSQYALFRWMTEGRWVSPTVYVKPRYTTLTQGTFEHWFGRLVEEGYIAIDSQGRAVASIGLEIVDKPDRSEIAD